MQPSPFTGHSLERIQVNVSNINICLYTHNCKQIYDLIPYFFMPKLPLPTQGMLFTTKGEKVETKDLTLSPSLSSASDDKILSGVLNLYQTRMR